jgi:hypothetical protein
MTQDPLRMGALRLASLSFLVLGAVLGSAPCAAAARLVQDETPQPVLDWNRKLTRDAQIAFTVRTAEHSLRIFRAEESTELERAVALVALGGSGELRERALLESWASEGESLKRRAAVLALGEISTTGPEALGGAAQLLEGLLDDADIQVAECALLALLRTRDPRWRDLADTFAGDATHRLAPASAELLVFALDREGSRPHRATELLLDLRWDAARRFGTIGGKAWSEAVLDELVTDDQFLDAVILHAASKLSYVGVRDHLLNLLINGTGEYRLRAAVRGMPIQFDRLVSSGLWSPASEAEWTAIVDEAQRSGVGSFMPGTMRRAAAVHSIAPTAAGLLADRDGRYIEALSAALLEEDVLLRRQAVRAIVGKGLDERLDVLTALIEDPDPEIRAWALVGRYLRNDRGALVQIDDDLTKGGVARQVLLDALCESARQPVIAAFLSQAVVKLEGTDRAYATAALFLRGSTADSSVLREAFDDLDMDSKQARLVVRALGRDGVGEDIEFLASRFPLEGHRELNIEIARILVNAGHSTGLPIVYRAVWRGPWNRSVLAAGIVHRTTGMRLLNQWLAKPPTFAADADIRRVGFAIGEWGGLEALNQLTRRLGGGGASSREPALQGALIGMLSARTH